MGVAEEVAVGDVLLPSAGLPVAVLLGVVFAVDTIIHAKESAPCDVRFTFAATNDSFMQTSKSCLRGRGIFSRDK